jgi:hypothetical protein
LARGRVWQGIRDWFRPVEEHGSRRAGAHAFGPAGSTRRSFDRGVASRIRTADLSPSTSSHPSRVSGPALGGWGQNDGFADWAGEAVLDDAVDERELLEFMALDIDPVPADPVFRERLKEELWEMVLNEGASRAKDS